jgi:hypothetical protein
MGKGGVALSRLSVGDMGVWLLLLFLFFLPTGCETFIKTKAIILLDTIQQPERVKTKISLIQLQRIEFAINRTEAATSVAENAARIAESAAQQAEATAQQAEEAALKADAVVEKIKKVFFSSTQK